MLALDLTMKGFNWFGASLLLLIVLTHNFRPLLAERIRNGRNSNSEDRGQRKRNNNNQRTSAHRQRTSSSQHLLSSLAVQPNTHHHIEDQHTEFVKGKSKFNSFSQIQVIEQHKISCCFVVVKIIYNLKCKIYLNWVQVNVLIWIEWINYFYWTR